MPVLSPRTGHDFLNDINRTGNRRKIHKLDLQQNLKLLCIQGHNSEKATYAMEKIFTNHLSDKRLISRIDRDVTQQKNIKK